MNNLLGYIEKLVVANKELQRVNSGLYNDDLGAAAVDIDYALEKLCDLVGLDKGSMEHTRLVDGRRRAA